MDRRGVPSSTSQSEQAMLVGNGTESTGQDGGSGDETKTKDVESQELGSEIVVGFCLSYT